MAGRWAPPMQLSPATSDPAEARQWFDDFRTAGVEGLVVKGAGTRYAPGPPGVAQGEVLGDAPRWWPAG